MSKFKKDNFIRIITLIESMEFRKESIWIPIGILEVMYDDDIGYIDQYFHTDKFNRDKEKLWKNLEKEESFAEKLWKNL